MNILWLKTELLHPLDKGGKIRTYEMLKHLKFEHSITYLTLSAPNDLQEQFDSSSEYCHRLVTVPHSTTAKFSLGFYFDLGFNLISPLPYALQKYQSEAMLHAVEKEIQQFNYDIIVCDFLTPSINLPEHPVVPTVLFQHNVEAVIWARHYQNATNKLKKTYFHNQWQKILHYEQATCRRFDAVIAVSEIDRDFMREEYGVERVYAVPTGVDTDYFRPLHNEPNPSELVFTGSMDWMPNEDAIFYFSEKILPYVAEQVPDVKLTVVGRNPTKGLVVLSQANPRIIVTGRVDDVRPYIDRAAAYVVPIRIGGGTRLKIYEAMAMAKPVISTTIGAEGLAVRDGKELLIADEPEAFAKAVIATLREKKLAQRLGQSAREVVCEKFDWSRVASAFSQVCESVRSGSLPARVV